MAVLKAKVDSGEPRVFEDQLHSLYWWIFNAFKMNEFIRAKALDELQRADANGNETLTEQHVSRESKRPRKRPIPFASREITAVNHCTI